MDHDKQKAPDAENKKKSRERSPLDGLLEDPKPSDRGVASLDKALWDPSRAKSEVEKRSGK